MSNDSELQELKNELAGKTRSMSKAKKAVIYGAAIVGGGIVFGVAGLEIVKNTFSSLDISIPLPFESLLFEYKSDPSNFFDNVWRDIYYEAIRNFGYGALPGEILGNILGYFGARGYIKRKENLG